jgi:hypothetical protein
MLFEYKHAVIKKNLKLAIIKTLQSRMTKHMEENKRCEGKQIHQE